jgi:hypothetical protein
MEATLETGVNAIWMNAHLTFALPNQLVTIKMVDMNVCGILDVDEEFSWVRDVFFKEFSPTA